MEMLADFFRVRNINGTGMRLLFGDADLKQDLENGLGLDLELAGQIVDANLIRVLRHTQWI